MPKRKDSRDLTKMHEYTAEFGSGGGLPRLKDVEGTLDQDKNWSPRLKLTELYLSASPCKSQENPTGKQCLMVDDSLLWPDGVPCCGVLVLLNCYYALSING